MFNELELNKKGKVRWERWEKNWENKWRMKDGFSEDETNRKENRDGAGQ